MISVGINVSKGKSTVCIMKPYGEIKIVMESTGKYHLPILRYFLEHNFICSVINPLIMHKYVNTVLRRGKTDKLMLLK